MSIPATLSEALSRYEPVIGLEVHAQLKTRSKLFTRTANQYDPEHPNHYISEYCVGLPGVLPILNKEAVAMAIKTGVALHCDIRERSVWSRKQYFYPDLPKGYQISQYDEPLCEDGYLTIVGDDETERRIHIIRIHMEEDAGKNVHVDGAPFSLVDYNRSGVPLVEIVSGPDLRSSAEAAQYLKELRSILMAIDVCDGNMEEGSFRCDANVSLRPVGTEPFGTRTEVKNINSFRFVQQAIDFEILRQARVLAEGGTIIQETRLFDSGKRETRSMRSKEEAHDYRYFPDPDLPPLIVERSWIQEIEAGLPELPADKRRRYQDKLGIPDEHARTFAEERDVAAFFERAVGAYPEGAVAIANMIKGEVLRELKDEPEGIRDAKVSPEDLAELVKLKEQDRISSTQQKKLFGAMWRDGTKLKDLLAKEGEQIDDLSVLEPIIVQVLESSPKEVERYKSGKTNVLGFFVGQVMKATKGKAKPPLVKELVTKKLAELE